MPVSSDVGSKLLAWLTAGAGTLLAYSAFKNRAPWDVLRDIEGLPLTTPTGSSSTGTQPSGFKSPGTDFSSSVPRIRMIANRELQPDLVPIRPSGRLDREAAASLERIHTAVGAVVPNVGSYRSFAEQAAAYAGNPNRFAPPTKSLHVVGLAIDVRNDFMNRSDVINAFTAEGWQRARVSDEPWHWSYLVRG